MSRNVDKANSILVRYQELKAEESGGYKDYSRYKRPKRVTSVKALNEAIEWRKQVLRDIKDKTTRIYDPSLNDFQLTELNNELNDLFKEKTRWDWHISQLPGGKTSNKRRRDDVVGGRVIAGKRYFGRALELPEVQELLKQQQLDLDSKKIGKGIIDTKKIPKDRSGIYYEGKKESNIELTEFESYYSDILRKKYKSGGQNDQGKREYMLTPGTTIPTLEDMEAWLVKRRKQKLLDELNL